jgi:hypothetical protein
MTLPITDSDGSSKGRVATVFDATAARDEDLPDADAADDDDDTLLLRSTGGTVAGSAAKSRDDLRSSRANTR